VHRLEPNECLLAERPCRQADGKNRGGDPWLQKNALQIRYDAGMRNDPFISIVGRFDEAAWDKLKKLRIDPLFGAVMAQLRTTEGTITALHVEQAHNAVLQESALKA
jgi:hypothetical protein